MPFEYIHSISSVPSENPDLYNELASLKGREKQENN